MNGSRRSCAAALARRRVPAAAAAARRDARRLGTLADGTAIEVITLIERPRASSARVITYGATLQSLLAPGPRRQARRRHARLRRPGLVRGPSQLLRRDGRAATPIASPAAASSLDGTQLPAAAQQRAQLAARRRARASTRWPGSRLASTSGAAPRASCWRYTSPDGDSGYPGKLDVTVTYALDDAGALAITFDATTDKPTIVNLTNHAHLQPRRRRRARRRARPAPDDPRRAPTRRWSADADPDRRAAAGRGHAVRLPHAPAASRRTFATGAMSRSRFGRGYDHNFALDKGLTAAPELAARLEDPVSGRVLEVLTTEPGVQVYAGNFLDGTLRRQVRAHLPDGRRHRARAAEIPRRAQSAELRARRGSIRASPTTTRWSTACRAGAAR